VKEISVDNLQARIRDIIAVELQIDADKVVPDANLRQDLGMDSVAALNILFAAEETFGIGAIDVTELTKVATVSDVETLVREHVALLRAS
jgi:acyl carrier protein